jgi:hypothetical protein
MLGDGLRHFILIYGPGLLQLNLWLANVKGERLASASC